MRVDLTADQFDRVRGVLDRAAGLVFDDSRRDSLCYSLGERMTVRSCRTVEDYLTVLGDGSAAEELQALLNEVTIQETHFFRNPPQFRALRAHVLPALIQAAVLRGDRRLRIWSAGCSTGEEPYSIAMLVREALPLLDGWDVQIVATDVSTRALEAARTAQYTARSLTVADPTDVARWFERSGADFVVRREARELVEFRRHNLVSDPTPFGDEPIDLILCRNVTIYFSRETTRSLMMRLHDRLADGGYLFLGHSETLWQINDRFRLVTLGDAFVYRRDTGVSTDRRTVLPDRRTADDPGAPQRRLAAVDRRLAAVAAQPSPPERAATPDGDVLPDLVADIRDLLAAGHYDRAAELARSVATEQPLRVEAHYLCGLALVNLGRDAEALVHLRKAVYVDPAAGFAHFLLAGTLARLGDGRGASRSYRAAAETLGRHIDDRAAGELGGRDVAELVDLCWQLAGVRKAPR